MHGPNCMGLLNFSDNVPLYSAEFPPKIRPGNVALLAQSGSAAIAVMNTLRAGFSKVVTVGSEFRVTATDYLAWLADDPATAVIGVILEAIQSPDAFAAAVRRVHAAGKSVVVLKVGRSAVGERAAQAHTGAMITPATAYECFFRDLGVPTVADYDQLAGALLALATFRPTGPGGVAVTGISGGETALMCDLVADPASASPNGRPTPKRRSPRSPPRHHRPQPARRLVLGPRRGNRRPPRRPHRHRRRPGGQHHHRRPGPASHPARPTQRTLRAPDGHADRPAPAHRQTGPGAGLDPDELHPDLATLLADGGVPRDARPAGPA